MAVFGFTLKRVRRVENGLRIVRVLVDNPGFETAYLAVPTDMPTSRFRWALLAAPKR